MVFVKIIKASTNTFSIKDVFARACKRLFADVRVKRNQPTGASRMLKGIESLLPDLRANHEISNG
jgi:hypothetical protein